MSRLREPFLSLYPLNIVGGRSTVYAWRVGGHNSWSTEGAVVGRIIDTLLDEGVAPADIKLEYRLDRHCRVDVAVLTGDPILLIECKGFLVGRYEYRRVIRYRDTAQAKWPDRRVLVMLAAPGRRTKDDDPPGIVSVVV